MNGKSDGLIPTVPILFVLLSIIVREMKDQIIKLLDDWKGQKKEVAKPEKKVAQQEK